MRVVHKSLFPFCVTEGIGVQAFSLDQCMEWYWRVQQWRIQIEYGMTGEEYEVDVVVDAIDPAFVSNESHLPCWTFVNFGSVGASTIISGPGTIQNYTIGIWIFRDPINPSDTPLSRFGSSYYPTFFSVFTAGFIFQPEYFTAATDITGTNPGTMDCDGIIRTMDSNPTLDVGQYVNVVATPYAWWPYAERVGGANPIYDSGTGVQLLDPFDYQNPLS